MITVVKRLLEGDRDIARQFADAHSFWKKFFEDKQDWTVEQFAEFFGMYQNRCEAPFGGDRPFAKEVVALTALGTLYDEQAGWDDAGDLAVRVAKGFLSSQASTEVKIYARDAVRLFELDKLDDELSDALESRAL